jgi:hypothetical protein
VIATQIVLVQEVSGEYVYNKTLLSRSWASTFGAVPKEFPSKEQKVRRYRLGTNALNGFRDAK